MKHLAVGPATCRGVTLIELIVSLVVIALAGVALLATMGFVASSSGQSLAQVQAQAIADAYLNEALGKPFSDPDGSDTETTRATFDDVDDYNGLSDTTARDQFGTAIGGPGRFQVSVAVVASSGLTGVPSSAVKRVDVTVRAPDGTQTLASGYRTSHP